MAGAVSFPKHRILTDAGLVKMRQLGLSIDVYLDLSHNETIAILCDGRATEIKKIHLDIAVEIKDPTKVDSTLTRLKEQPTNSDAFEMRVCLMKPECMPHLGKRPVSIEVPSFDNSIALLSGSFVPDDIKDAVTCCRAKTKAEFNALPVDVRKKMGMYLRSTNQGFRQTSPQKERSA